MYKNTGIIKLYSGYRVLSSQHYYTRAGRKKIINERVTGHESATHIKVYPFAIRLGATKDEKHKFYVKQIKPVAKQRTPAKYTNMRSPFGVYSDMKDELK